MMRSHMANSNEFYHVAGSRLLMLNAQDIAHFGLPSQAAQDALRAAIAQLREENRLFWALSSLSAHTQQAGTCISITGGRATTVENRVRIARAQAAIAQGTCNTGSWHVWSPCRA